MACGEHIVYYDDCSGCRHREAQWAARDQDRRNQRAAEQTRRQLDGLAEQLRYQEEARAEEARRAAAAAKASQRDATWRTVDAASTGSRAGRREPVRAGLGAGLRVRERFLMALVGCLGLTVLWAEWPITFLLTWVGVAAWFALRRR